MPWLNQHIFALDSTRSIGELITGLNFIKPDFVVFRVSNAPPASDQFFVFTRSYLQQKILVESHAIRQELAVTRILPALNDHHRAPQISLAGWVERWLDEYESGPWPAAAYPVSIANGQAIGVWEPVNSNSAWVWRDELPASHYGETQNGLPENRPPNRRITEHLSAPTTASEESVADEIKTQPHCLYPNIEASNAHPVIEEVVTISVSLQATRASDMMGLVSLPETHDAYVIQVHLLCAGASHWGELEYSQSMGMLQAAQFQVHMPDMPLDFSGNYPERHKLPVRVNFYFQSRWCGEGERYLDLRLDHQVTPLRRIPPPPKSEWHRLVRLDLVSQPPDLLVRISHLPGTSSYHWSCLSPHMTFHQPMNAVMTLDRNAREFVNHLFEPFATVTLDDFQESALNGIFEEIYDCTPTVFKQALWELRDASKQAVFSFKNILFVSDEPYIPWELMRVTDSQHQEGAGILGVTHCVGRWLASHSSHLSQQIEVARFAASGSDYVDQRMIPNLPHVTEELRQLTQTYGAERVALNSSAMIEFLQTGEAQALHIACHGRMSAQTPYKSELLMEDHPRSITPPQVSSYEVETGLGSQHPLVFLNACQAGASGSGLSLVSGFPAAFLKAGASAVICPLWTVDDQQASEVAKLFYATVAGQPGMTLGEVMQRIHAKWTSQGQLTYLAYVLYGDPQTRVEFRNFTEE